MKVDLMQHSVYPIETMATIASICYGKEESKNPKKLVQHLNELEHHSVFEHIFYTFKIEGISRACLAQLTRHRHASYTVRSQRYCEESNFQTVIPESILQDKNLKENYLNLMEMISNHYDGLRESGVSKEDARAILPQSTTTDLYMSCNLRELMHIYKLRTDKSAQKEIQDLSKLMVSKVIGHTPELKFLFKEEEKENDKDGR